MAMAQTAQLLVDLNLGGNFNSGMTQAESSLTRFSGVAATSGARTGILSGAFSKVGVAAGAVGGALSHAGNQIKNLVTGPLGMIGLAGGLFTFGGALEQAISKAGTEAAAIEKLTAVTGNSAETLSALLAVTDKYNISADRLVTISGFAEKAMGNIQVQAKGAAKFQTEFGFSILDSSGKVKDFNTLLLTFSDYYSRNTNEAQKAAAAAKLFGRGYVDLVPVLALGSAGIRDAEQAAADLGLTLNATNVKDLAGMKEATRGLGEAMGGLELQIGLALIPTITELSTSIAKFVGTHRTDIVNLFKDVVAFGKTAAGVISGFAGSLVHFWNMIPEPIRNLMVGSFLVDKTIKWLFGFSITGSIAGAFESGLSNALGKSIAAAGLGKLFVQPVFVTNPGFGGMGGLPGAAGGAAEAAGVGLGAVLAAVIAIPAAILAANALKNAAGITDAQQQYLNTHGQFGPRSAANIPRGLTPEDMHQQRAAQAFADSLNLASEAASHLRNSLSGTKTAADRLNAQYQKEAKEPLKAILDRIQAASAARYGGTGLGPAAVEGTFARYEGRVAAEIMKSGETNAQKLDQIKQVQQNLLARGDRTAAHKLDTLIATLRAKKLSVVVDVNPTMNMSISVADVTRKATIRQTFRTLTGAYES